MKRLRYFCHVSQEGGIPPPLLQMEAVVQRYPQSWEDGSIVGIISSSVAKQYLLGHGHPVGSFLLRMQFNSPSELCASSVQIHPQSGATFVDHLTISDHVAPNDQKLMEYLANSPVHQLLLPSQKLCAAPTFARRLSFKGSESSAYRTTDIHSQRTNTLLQDIQTRPSRSSSQSSKRSPSVTRSLDALPSINFTLSHPNLDPRVSGWLSSILEGEILEEVMTAFESERVTFASLEVLEAEDLKEMNIPIGPRKELLEAIQNLSESTESG
jgi:hypothetical protein